MYVSQMDFLFDFIDFIERRTDCGIVELKPMLWPFQREYDEKKRVSYNVLTL